MNDIAQIAPFAVIGDVFDLYPATIIAKGSTLRLVSATGEHGPDSPFNVLEAVWGLPCDGLTYIDDTERSGRHLVAVFHGATEESTAVAICHDWRWKWFAGTDIGAALRLCLKGLAYDSAPPAGTIVGDLARKGAEVAG